MRWTYYALFLQDIDVSVKFGTVRRFAIMKADHLMREFWVFGYGSLMWRPGFTYRRALPAKLWGYHRALCIYSHVHRGTPECPGLVLGLDRGGSCRGVAFEIAPEQINDTLAYLRERELATNVYLEVTRPITLFQPEPRKVEGVCFIADRTHDQYAGKLAPERLLALVVQGRGGYGDNRDYVLATQEHLKELGIHDPSLTWLSARLRHQAL